MSKNIEEKIFKELEAKNRELQKWINKNTLLKKNKNKLYA